ncbi:MAG TPA: C25 family cysteine peptidase [Terriglobales bacterium]
MKRSALSRLSFLSGLLMFFALAQTVRAQVVIGNEVSAQDEVNRNNLTITTANLTPAGTNRLLLVGISIDINNNTGVTATGVTLNTGGVGTSLTFLGARNDTANDHRVEMWYLLNPPAAAHTITATFSSPGGSFINPTEIGAAVGAIAFSNVDQTTPLGTFVSAQGGTSSASTLNVTSGTGQVVVDTLAIDGRRTATAGAGQTRQWGLDSGTTTGTDVYGFGSTEAGAPTVTMSETFSGTSEWAMGAVSVMPVPPPATTEPFTVTGTNNVLIVGVSMNISGNTGATVSSVTYNGAALTLAGAHNDAGDTRRVEIWYLAAPATGTHNIVVNYSATVGAVVGATNVTGADQTSPVRDFTSDDGAADALSTLNVPSANGDVVVDTLAIAGTDSVTAYGPTQTQAWASASGATGTDVYGSGSTRAGAASVPLSETFNANSNWSLGAVSVRPFQADLSVAVSGNAVAFPGNITYTAVVTNNGPSTATGASLTDTLPSGLTFVSVTGTGCGHVGSVVTCNIGTLTSNATSTVTIVATPTMGGGYPDTASVTGTVTDLDTGNNAATGIGYSQLNVCTVPTTTVGGTLTGVINTYYPGSSSVAAGATSITLGTATGSATPIASGDEVLIIQMQDAAISSNNDGTYGDGSTGSGWTNLNNAGVYEFATATSAVPVGGGTLTIAGAGPGGGLLFGYNSAAASGTQGQRTFQVVRVPHFATATLGTGLTAAAWNGSTGGIFVLDTSGALTLGGHTVTVDGLGFRGGAGLELNGGVAGSSTNDYRQVSPTTYPAGPAFTGVPVAGIDGPKGEGIAGTPMWVQVANTPFSTGVDGYPNGSMGRGAPGNAGGGGTDANVDNDQNSGGGGGANGGAGGFGGDAWDSNLSVGGLGGAPFPSSTGRVVMGGGGGAGSRNNSDNNTAGAPTRIAQASSGAAGGGIIIIRAGSITGTGTMSANGANAYDLTSNDAGGGGGAGGTVIVLSTGGAVGTLTANAAGGSGGDAWDDDAAAGPPIADRHGPGGGGGGGVVLLSGAGTVNVAAGTHGTTLPAPGQFQYGATDGQVGTSATNITYASTPGPHYNATCIDVAVTKTAPATALLGNTFSYSLGITNNGATAASAVTLTDTLPAGVTFSSVTPAASCSQTAGTVTCNYPTLAAGASVPAITINVIAAALGTVTNTANVTETQADYNLVNNTASASTTILPASDMSITKTGPATANQGDTITYTLTAKNNGPTVATTIVVTDTLPSQVSFSSASAGCSFSAGTVTCTAASLAVNATAVFTVSVIAQTVGSAVNTAVVSASQTDPTSANNTSSVTTVIGASAEISIVKTASANPVKQGDTFSYILTVLNNGPSTATAVTATDILPTGVTFSSASAGCSYAAPTRTVTCTAASLALNATVVFNIQVVAGAPAQVNNTATVTAAQFDSVLANNTSTFLSTITFTTEVKLQSFSAISTAGGVLLTWRTGGEVRNLGFNVYRDQNGRRIRVNPSLIAGSSLMMRRADSRHSGKSYAWLDRNPPANSYWLEDVDLNGTRTLHGPIAIESAPSSPMDPSVTRTMDKSRLPQPSLGQSALARSFRGQPSMSQSSVTIANFNSSTAPSDSSISHLKKAAPVLWRTPTALQTQYQIAAGPAIKIAVDHEGWYRVTQAQLVAAGLNPSVNPDTLQLFAEGVEQPIMVTGSHGGFGGFGRQAAIQFYGTGIDTAFSNQRIYWLVSGNQTGARIQYAVVSHSGQQSQSFPQTVELQEKTTFFAALLRTDTDHFFGALVSSTPVDQVLTTPDLAPSGDAAKLEVVLQGGSDEIVHDVTVSFNGASLGDMQFSNEDEGTADFTVPYDSLQHGSDIVTLTSQNGEEDLSLVDHITLTYPRSYTAESDTLKFTAQGGDLVTVKNFQQTPTQVLDITNPGAPLELPFRVRTQSRNIALDINVAGFQSVTHQILALADDQIGQPASITANQPSNWHSAQSGADLVMISAPDFLTQMAPLVQLRQSQGHTVALINVQDIYDEFNFGEKDPTSIRTFLQNATKVWKHAPKYLLLVGDASIDPRNYLGFGNFDFVPTALVPTAELTTASDDWFSDFTGAGLAQISTGRLPVQTADEAQTVVGKIVGYDSGQNAGAWSSQALMVADKDDSVVPFTQQAQTIQSLLPPSISVTDVFASSMTASAAQQAVLNGINNGALLVNYDGHGSVEVWSDENLLTSALASSLTNGPRLPMFVIMNCLNGYFQDVYTVSMAESLLLANNGGAVAVWASSSLTSPGPQFQMDQAFTSAVFTPGETIGDAIQAAKSAITDSDVRRTFILFGDPSQRLQTPAAAPTSSSHKGSARRASH